MCPEVFGTWLPTRSCSAAWTRVEAWYAGGEWAPEPEVSHWLLDPDGEFARLSAELRKGYQLKGPWPLFPYPKKGAQIRHYCQPTVADQVVFTAFGLLLAPFLEARMNNFSFANRWYRGVYWDRSENCWANRPHSLRDRQLYEPYRRGYGLFRRTAQWVAGRCWPIRSGLGPAPALSHFKRHPGMATLR